MSIKTDFLREKHVPVCSTVHATVCDIPSGQWTINIIQMTENFTSYIIIYKKNIKCIKYIAAYLSSGTQSCV